MSRTKRALEKGYSVTDNGTVIGLRGRPLKPNIDRDGRPTISVRCYGPSRIVKVHQLAALQRFGEASLCGDDVQIRHLDGDPTNNSVDNLALGTLSQNMMDKPLEVRLRTARKAAFALRSLTEEQVRSLRADRADGWKYVDLMAKYDLAKSTVSDIVRRVTYAGV